MAPRLSRSGIVTAVVGAGSFLLHQFSLILNSIFQSLGMSEEMYNPVAIFVILGIILAGAALGYWIVRRFVISKEDGSVDTGVAQFVKWAMRIIGTTFILQSTLDPLLAIGALITCGAVCNLFSATKWLHGWYETLGNDDYSLQWVQGKRGHAEFLSKSTPKGKHWSNPKGKMWNSPKRSAWTDSPVRGVVSPSSGISSQPSGTHMGRDYYSTFHKTRNRKKFSKQEWDEFTRESTKQALAEWAASPEFTDWIVEHADRIKVLPSESSDETMGSESDSADVGSGSGFQLFKWQ
ncbi:unnamed protein product [Sphenostylis stenocarpa]|uniref:Uncharacterized protein n=1 Tax=Sphenostylis stenocarpa TaxID=92480 RepID=A0AA86S5P2_9FABA|nr:unnamed protein product [Sphenostylis stenocarpa]